MEKLMTYIRYKFILIIIVLFVLLFSDNVNGIMLRGYFPISQGRFWNFVQSKDNSISTWAINGTLTLKEVGRVFIMVQDNGTLLCMRDDWQGLYIYSEYGPNKYLLPEKPPLFLPSSLKPGVTVKASSTLKVFSDPEGRLNFKDMGRINREITFRLKGFEDIEIGSNKFRQCATVEKTTKEQNSITTEIIWLAPLIGPVKRVIRSANENITYTILSYSKPEIKQNQCFSIKDLYPLKSGITRVYQGHDNNFWSIITKENESINGVTTTPFAEDTGDIYYYAIDSTGLILPKKFWSAVGGCTLFHPPDPPVVVLPAILELGSYYSSTSPPRVHAWPSMTLAEDFFTETQYSSIPLCLENVDVPFGTYKECLKTSLFSISRNFSVRNEKIRVGYIWLAKDVGTVKEELIDITNYFHPERTNRIDAIRFWKLADLKKNTMN